MIKIHSISNVSHTLFSTKYDIAYLHEQGVVFTDSFEEADILIASKLDEKLFKSTEERQKKNSLKPKPILIWTHEPRYSKTNQTEINDLVKLPIYNMNLYTGDVYFSNITIYGYCLDSLLTPVDDVIFADRPIIALATRIDENVREFVLNDIDIDLSVKRQNLITDGFNFGLVDVYGRGWPKSIAKGESRGEGWKNIKAELLKNYQYNICMENTAYPYYCTEKIWDSIKGYCLPIYSSWNNKIYETFPENSFLDFNNFKSNTELLLYVKSLSKNEYLDRLNLCISIFNQLFKTRDIRKEKAIPRARISQKLNEIYQKHCR